MEDDRKATTNNQSPLAEGCGRVQTSMTGRRKGRSADVEESPVNSWEPINGICEPGG